MSTKTDESLPVEFEQTVKYNYFDIGPGKCTLAYQVSKNRNSRFRSVKFGFAFCSPKDKYSKNDVQVTKVVWSEPPNRDNWDKVTKTLEVVKTIKGGRTLAREMLEFNPIEMELYVPLDRNPIAYMVEQMQNYAFDNGPGWKFKTKLRRFKSGAYELSKDGITLVFDDPKSEHLVRIDDGLHTYTL